MNEDKFADLLVAKVRSALLPHRVERKRCLLYDLSFDHRGIVTMGVDHDSGKPIRGGGRGFEQDILVFDEVADSHTSVVPRVVAEVKFGHVTTHDAIVYSEKADRIRRVYPYVRYGFVLGGLPHIPGRVLRLGQRFDFMVALATELPDDEVAVFSDLLAREARISEELTQVLYLKRKTKSFERRLVIGPVSSITAAAPDGGGEGGEMD